MLASISVVISGVGITTAVKAVRGMRNEVVFTSYALGDLQYFMQESRRHYVSALGATDPAHELELTEESNQAVQAQLKSLAQLSLPEAVETGASRFNVAWQTFLQTQARGIALLEERDVSASASLGNQVTADFDMATAASQDIRRLLDDHARTQAASVESTFLRLLLELVLLILTLGWFSWALLGSRTQEIQVREHSERLARAANLEANRSLILELTGKNEPLPDVLEALCRLVEQQLSGSIAAVSLYDRGEWSSLASLSLPGAFIAALRGVPKTTLAGSSRLALQTHEPAFTDIDTGAEWETLRGAARAHGYRNAWSYPVLSNTGEPLATVDVYFHHRHRPEKSELEALRGAAQLAAMAIEHRDLYEKLSFQSQRDALTELPNRRLLQERLEQTLVQAERDGQMAAVLMIDLDWFKQVNDQLGHRAGDSVLRGVAQRLTQAVRRGDTVARVGGDEFTVVLSNVNSAEQAEQSARRILARLMDPISVGENSAQIAASIGISVYPSNGVDAATLTRHADVALYHVKSRGRHGVQLYGDQIGSALRKRMNVEKALVQALQNKELQLHYQPQTDIHMNLIGMEALIRWSNAEFGSVSPAEFIPVAESSGLIVPIGSWALREACRQSVEWQRLGYASVKMAVNVSARQLAEANFVELVRQTLVDTGLAPEHLELELTETTLMEHVDESLDRLSQLRDLGVTVAIDDFGTGYSSLSYLQRLPVACVKIDLSFVRDISAVSTTVPVIQAIIDLAHGMDLKVLAEGVETEEQLETLRQLGCDAIQGYLIRRAGPPQEVESFLSRGTTSLVKLNRQVQHAQVQVPLAAASQLVPTVPARRRR